MPFPPLSGQAPQMFPGPPSALLPAVYGNAVRGRSKSPVFQAKTSYGGYQIFPSETISILCDYGGRPGRGDPGFRGGATGAMVREKEHPFPRVIRFHPSPGGRPRFDIAGQPHGKRAVPYFKDKASLVRAGFISASPGASHGNMRASCGEYFPSVFSPDEAGIARDRVSEGRERFVPGYPYFPDGKLFEQGSRSAEMVLVGMGEDQRVQPAGARASKEGSDDSCARIPVRRAPAIDDHALAVGKGDDVRGSFAHVERGDIQAGVGQGRVRQVDPCEESQCCG